MTPAESQFWQRANRRAMEYTPDIRSAILRAFQIIRDSLSETELQQIVASGNLDRLFQAVFSQDVMDRAFAPVRYRIRESTERSFRYFTADLPKGGKIDGVLAIRFDYLNPQIVTAIRTMETRVMTTLQENVRDTVRAFVENGIRNGNHPRAIAREIRSVVGLAPNQEQYIRNLRAELESGNFADAKRRVLLDKRFNLDKLSELSEAERAKRIDTIMDAYRKRYTAFNAETNARTAALDAMKLGQRLSWQAAIDSGLVDGSRLYRRWVGVMDSREREAHRLMEGDTVPFEMPHRNGEMIPGSTTFNCRCLDRYVLMGAA